MLFGNSFQHFGNKDPHVILSAAKDLAEQGEGIPAILATMDASARFQARFFVTSFLRMTCQVAL